MNEQYWSWIVTIIGLIGFRLSGRKVWWAWYINIFNQVLWATFAIVTEQLGFLVGVPFYMYVFGKNAYEWTIDRQRPILNACESEDTHDIYAQTSFWNGEDRPVLNCSKTSDVDSFESVLNGTAEPGIDLEQDWNKSVIYFFGPSIL